LRERLLNVTAARVVLEASGGVETALVAELGAAEPPIVMVNPRHVRDFARVTGQLAKTDALDARMLACSASGSALNCAPCPPSRSVSSRR
jgi:transposase